MKTKLLALSALVMILCVTSCKKDSAIEPMTVKYEIINSLPFVTVGTYAGSGYITFTDSNKENVTVRNLTGKTWTKTVVIQNPKKGEDLIQLNGDFYLQGEGGTCSIKIYVNGVEKSTQTVNDSQNNSGTTIISVSRFWLIE
jgi:hypothetical protein